MLAYRRAVEFAIDAGFLELVIEGDNVAVMISLSHGGPNMSQLGHVVHDIQWLATGLRWLLLVMWGEVPTQWHTFLLGMLKM